MIKLKSVTTSTQLQQIIQHIIKKQGIPGLKRGISLFDSNTSFDTSNTYSNT